jgi:hypothetical protein
MRATRWTFGATCALAIIVFGSSALAGHADAKKSLAECTSFEQNDKGDSAVEFTVKNSCTVPIDCSISWRVVCAPESHKRRSVHASSTKLTLNTSQVLSAQASAAACGDDGWSIDDVHWSCEPNKE